MNSSYLNPFKELRICNYSYEAKLVVAPDFVSSIASHRLRHNYFVKERGWVSPDPDNPELEVDCYDLFCFHLAVFEQAENAGDEPHIAAYLRVLPWQEETGFMLQHEFSCLLPKNYPLITSNSVELSRFVIAPYIKARGTAVTQKVIELLLKLLYRLSLQQEWDAYYIVVEESWLTAFVRRYALPFTPVGEPFTFPDGTKTIAAVAYRSEMEESVRRSDPAKHAWYVAQDPQP
jgi:N-acyl-L-homoserine lactone synthetase